MRLGLRRRDAGEGEEERKGRIRVRMVRGTESKKKGKVRSRLGRIYLGKYSDREGSQDGNGWMVHVIVKREN